MRENTQRRVCFHSWKEIKAQTDGDLQITVPPTRQRVRFTPRRGRAPSPPRCNACWVGESTGERDHKPILFCRPGRDREQCVWTSLGCRWVSA
ncbi:hypothetical protein SKAU_G00030530 [Synaphobranchus kaupii]|uniref:Uncharacterized protein n=1 Tax=Synaphobranchus kaupii TaxID=118154 RepID=A0A9Q1JF14_SYNKA|nr:hypothetical protein SKAU_G00030530 [Synaphobranchus kaupii]